PVQTIAHWIPASRQILDDAPALQDFLNSRMSYMLKIEEERQLLSGSGSSNNLTGLLTQASLFDTTPVTPSSDTYLDVIRLAMLQVEDGAKLEADGIILNPRDVARLDRIKESGSGISSGKYIYSDPHSRTGLTLWGLPVVSSFAIAESQFL